MREADKQKVLRSYTTEWDKNKKRWVVKQETWVPGHTEAHKETPEAALRFREEKLFKEVVELNNQRSRISVDLAALKYNKENI